MLLWRHGAPDGPREEPPNFTLEVFPRNYKHRINPFPSMKPSKKLKFRVAEQVREVPV